MHVKELFPTRLSIDIFVLSPHENSRTHPNDLQLTHISRFHCYACVFFALNCFYSYVIGCRLELLQQAFIFPVYLISILQPLCH